MSGALAIGLPERSGARVAPDATQDASARRMAGSVQFKGLGKTYTSSAGEVQALRDIHLDIEAGEIFGIIGRSGAGKSSLLRSINRLEQPSEGRVLIDGDDIAGLNEAGLIRLRRRIGMIFQHFNLLASKTVRENVALPLLIAGVPRGEAATRVAEVLKLVGLEGKEDTYPSRLSGGQKQRVGIARALVNRPEILLCDEATSALDPETTLSILRLLRDINRRLGLTIILINHEMSVIREICHRVLVLERGQIVETGPVWQVFARPQHDATQALLAPLKRDLPPDLAARLHPRAESPTDLHVVELTIAGEATPDLSVLSSAIGGPVRLVQAAVERIQGHAVGRLVVLLPASAGPARLPLAARSLGYVPAND